MSPLPPSTPTSVLLGRATHHNLEVKEVHPCREDTESVKEIQPQVQPRVEDVESVNEILLQVKDDNAFNQQRQAELDQTPKDLSTNQPQAEEVNSFQQQKQAELDEWRKFRDEHMHGPKEVPNPIKILEDLFDIAPADSAPVPVAAQPVAGISKWKRRNKGRSSGNGHYRPKSL